MNFKNLIYAFMDYSDAGQNDFSAMTLFLPRCNLRCPYCMNGRLLTIDDFQQERDLLEKFERRLKHLKVSHVIISGGEPTIYPIEILENLIKYIRGLGVKNVGMSTNGVRSDILERILPKLDFVALDLKGDLATYEKLGGHELFQNVLYSILLLRYYKSKNENFNYEIRTTVYPEFINMDVIRTLSIYVCGDNTSSSSKWVLTQFRPVKNMPCKKRVKPYTDEYLEELANEARKKVKDVEVRYV